MLAGPFSDSKNRDVPNKPVNRLPEVADSIFCTAVMSTGSGWWPSGAAAGSSWLWSRPCVGAVLANEAIPLSLCLQRWATGSSHGRTELVVLSQGGE